jgi:uncharacterized membrane protein
MTGGRRLVLPNQDAERNPEIQTVDNISWEQIPEKRKWWRVWLASVIICLVIATLIICHGLFIENETIEYKQVFDLSASTLEKIRNGSIKIYTREVKKTYPVLLNLGLGVLAIIFGTFVDRLSLVAEEFFHFESRYNRKKLKMVKACLSGISWPAVVLVIVLVIIICIIVPLANNATFELRHLTYILSGIGVGPLVMHLLSLNTQSEVHISTILEEKETYVANGLAWSCYFNYLENAVLKFKEKFPNNSYNSVQDNGEEVRLDSNKLILLISHDCSTTDNLAELDNKIIKQGEISNDKFIFPVYQLTYNNCAYTYVIKYLMQPLQTLKKMSQYGRIKALDEKQREYQVKLLCRTLSDILEDPFNDECKEKCILVAMKANSKENLNNGGLVNAIMHKVRPDEFTYENMDGFEIIPTWKAKQQQVTGDDTSDLHGKLVNLSSSHKVTIDSVEGTAQYNKQDIDNQDGQANTFERSEEPVNAKKLQRKYKRKSSQREREPMLQNDHKTSAHGDVQTTQDRKCEGTKTMLPKRQVDDPKESGGIEETDQCMSSNLVDGEHYGRRLAISDVQPMFGHTAETGSHSTSANSANGGRNSPREEETSS